MVDVLILYESRRREIENCVLLLLELEQRGYKVKIRNIYNPYKYFIKTKVLVVPHLYNNEQLFSFGRNFWNSNERIISLQCEQILNPDVEEDDIHNTKEQAVFAHHIAWGLEQAKRYLNFSNIDINKIHITGSIAMDLMRNEFSDYFISRKEMAKRFNLRNESEWVLFVSSFSYAHLSEEEINRNEKMWPASRLFSELSTESQDIILYWFRESALLFPDKEFIYRPHPAEKNIGLLLNSFNEIPNLHVIGDYSMRQWAKVSDKIYNWFSTSIADIYFAQKTCFILRPIVIPRTVEVSILEGVESLKTYEEYVESLKRKCYYFPVRKENMEFFYGELKGRMAYQKIADLCEDLIKGKIDGYKYDWGNRSRFNTANVDSLSKIIFNYLNFPFYTICKVFKVEKVVWPFVKKKHVVRLFDLDIYGIEKEIKEYRERLLPIVKRIKTI